MFAKAGIGQERLILRGPSQLAQMMQEYAQVDIALDPFPYNGGVTSLQAMWMGVPLITLEGGNFVGRMGASFLHAMGLDDWIALDEAGYRARAATVAKDRGGPCWISSAACGTVCGRVPPGT